MHVYISTRSIHVHPTFVQRCARHPWPSGNRAMGCGASQKAKDPQPATAPGDADGTSQAGAKGQSDLFGDHVIYTPYIYNYMCVNTLYIQYIYLRLYVKTSKLLLIILYLSYKYRYGCSRYFSFSIATDQDF
jgi:hypothetical protein